MCSSCTSPYRDSLMRFVDPLLPSNLYISGPLVFSLNILIFSDFAEIFDIKVSTMR